MCRSESRRCRRLLAVCLGLLLAGGGSSALARGGPQTRPGLDRWERAAERAAKILGALTAPAQKQAFEVELEVSLGGAVYGKAVLSAQPGEYQGKPAWRVTDRVVLSVDPISSKTYSSANPGIQQESSLERKAWLARDLSLLHLQRTEMAGGKEYRSEFTPAEGGVHVRNEGYGQYGFRKPEQVIECKRAPIATLAGLVLFLRACPPKPAGYAVPFLRERRPEAQDFVVTDWQSDAGESADLQKLRVEGKTALPHAAKPTTAWLASQDWSRMGTNEQLPLDDLEEHDPFFRAGCQLYFDPARRDLLAIRYPGAGITLARPGLLAPPAAIDRVKPPATAEEAAIRLLLGIGRRDRALAEGAVHWPEMRWRRPPWSAFTGDPGKVEQGPPRTSLDDLLDESLDWNLHLRWQRSMSELPSDLAAGVVRAAVLSAEATRTKEQVTLKLAASLKGIRVTAKKVGGGWLVVEAVVPRTPWDERR